MVAPRHVVRADLCRSSLLARVAVAKVAALTAGACLAQTYAWAMTMEGKKGKAVGTAMI
jgi:hypothetical protein